MGVAEGIKQTASRVLYSEAVKGMTLIERGHPDEAERHLTALLRSREKPGHVERRPMLMARRVVGTAQYLTNRPFDALETCRTALGHAERYRDPALVFSLRSDLVAALGAAGRHSEAEAEVRLLCDGDAANRGHIVHHYMGIFQLNQLLHMTGRLAEAVGADTAVLPRMTDSLGPKHFLVLQCRAARARRLALLGQFDQAEADCADIVAITAKWADKQWQMANARRAALTALAFCLTESGRPMEAERSVRSALATAEQSHGVHSRDAQPLRYSLGFALVGQKRYEEALALADIRPAWGGFEIGDHHLLRAEALYGLGRAKDAELAATHALNEAITKLAPSDHRVLRIRSVLAVIREAPGQLHALAAEWAQHYGPNHPRTRAAQAAL
ncbi:hypothetical protein ACFO3J_26770 [Streptomyces polygonati]|uniref:Tetratricopeptide repeat protein n=1 Tax=Streptomyces polygonati TaxID=1617087 RepID=A0ABV8HSS6_9ACTN